MWDFPTNSKLCCFDPVAFYVVRLSASLSSRMEVLNLASARYEWSLVWQSGQTLAVNERLPCMSGIEVGKRELRGLVRGGAALVSGSIEGDAISGFDSLDEQYTDRAVPGVGLRGGRAPAIAMSCRQRLRQHRAMRANCRRGPSCSARAVMRIALAATEHDRALTSLGKRRCERRKSKQ
jgi:hypothetical protein